MTNREFCDAFCKEGTNNKKGQSFEDRFIDIISDPNNMLINHHPEAGKVSGSTITLHQGVKVSTYGYYGDFSECLKINYGVHEPSEERMFAEVLKDIPQGATMIELGSYWAMYSIWFQKEIKDAVNYCIEPDPQNLEVGVKNALLNDVTLDFTQGYIAPGHIEVSQFVKENNIEKIDMLHSDIQGSEIEMLKDVTPLLKDKKISYIFVSTHSDPIHKEALSILDECDYRIIASADFETQTFCMDGIIVACPKDNEKITYTSLGNRQKTPLRSEPYRPDFHN